MSTGPEQYGGQPGDHADHGDHGDQQAGAPVGDPTEGLLGRLTGGGGGLDLNALMAQATQMQQQLMAAQDQLAGTQVHGTAGGGLVRATVTGSGEVVGLEIDPSAIDPTDAEGLADLVLAAIRDATRVAAELQQQAMGPLAGGLDGLGDLGGDLGGGLGLPGR